MTALLEEKARLTGMAAGALWGVHQGGEKGQPPAMPTSISAPLRELDKACNVTTSGIQPARSVVADQDQLARGLGKWAAACELAHIVGMFAGPQTHLSLAGQHGPMFAGEGGCAMLSTSLARKC